MTQEIKMEYNQWQGIHQHKFTRTIVSNFCKEYYLLETCFCGEHKRTDITKENYNIIFGVK